MVIVVSVMVLFAFFGAATTEAFKLKDIVKTGDKGETKQPDKQDEPAKSQGKRVPTLQEASKDPNFISLGSKEFYLKDSVKYVSEDPMMITATLVEYVVDRVIYTDWQIHYKLWDGSKQRVVRRTMLQSETYANGRLNSTNSRGTEDVCYASTPVGIMAKRLYQEKTGGSGYPLVF